MHNYILPDNKKIYFLSDFHLGIPMDDENHVREKYIINALYDLANDAFAFILIGDIFDAWFEYKSVVPKGFVRFLGCLANLRDRGIIIHIYSGNHDIWMDDYFQREMDIPVFHSPQMYQINNLKLYVGHGDGLGPGDKGYKILKKILRSPICQFLYRWVHPDIGLKLAQYFSRKGVKHLEKADAYHGNEKEMLFQYSKYKLTQEHFDYFIFGHRHLALSVPVSNNSIYINTGDWITLNSFGVCNGQSVQLKYYKKMESY